MKQSRGQATHKERLRACPRPRGFKRGRISLGNPLRGGWLTIDWWGHSLRSWPESPPCCQVTPLHFRLRQHTGHTHTAECILQIYPSKAHCTRTHTQRHRHTHTRTRTHARTHIHISLCDTTESEPRQHSGERSTPIDKEFRCAKICRSLKGLIVRLWLRKYMYNISHQQPDWSIASNREFVNEILSGRL